MRSLAMMGTAVLLTLTAGCSRVSDRAGSGGAEPAARPSFVVIVVDDWAHSDLESTRADGRAWNDLLAVDLLAAFGQEWRNFYSQPTCNPTRSSLMHGRWIAESQGGVCNPVNSRTPTPSGTLASVLDDAGYSTAAFGKWHVARGPDPAVHWTRSPAAYGFDAWRAWNASNLNGHCQSKGYEDWHRVDDGVVSRSYEYHTEAVALAFHDWWQATSGPRLAYVCFQAPHQPLHHPPAHLLPAGYPASTSDRERYDAMLVALDTLVASMLSVIDLSNTYVFLFGDNGTPPEAVRPDQDDSRVKSTAFEDGVNVPFLVAGPGLRAGVTDALGHVVDLPATLADLAGATVPDGAFPDSRSLASVLTDPAARARDHLFCDLSTETTITTPFGELTEVERSSCVVLETPSGLVKGKYDHLSSAFGTRDTEEFFDLGVHPDERVPIDPLDPLYAETVGTIRALWAEYEASRE